MSFFICRALTPFRRVLVPEVGRVAYLPGAMRQVPLETPFPSRVDWVGQMCRKGVQMLGSAESTWPRVFPLEQGRIKEGGLERPRDALLFLWYNIFYDSREGSFFHTSRLVIIAPSRDVTSCYCRCLECISRLYCCDIMFNLSSERDVSGVSNK